MCLGRTHSSVESAGCVGPQELESSETVLQGKEQACKAAQYEVAGHQLQIEASRCQTPCNSMSAFNASDWPQET